jgi:hypothetical protein
MARVPNQDGRERVEDLGRQELPLKKPPAPSARRGAVTSVVEEINEVHARVRAAAEHGCDLVRCMGCGSPAELPISRRGRRLRCTRCGAAELNISMIEPDPGQPAQRTRRKAAR